MKKILLLSFLLSFACISAVAQCPLGFSFGTEDNPPTASTDCDGNVFNEEISAANWAGDYATINNLAEGETYCFSTSNGDTDYLTIYDDLAGASIADGPADGSLCVTTLSATTTLYMQINLNDGACGTEDIVRTTSIFCSSCPEAICGCNDETACNYDPASNFNDGTCEFPLTDCNCGDALGCTDMAATNFDAAAMCNDGSCEYSATCGGIFTDSGGPNGDYGSNEQDTTVICPDVAGEVVSVTFTSFSSENNFDEMLIFDGADTGAPAILVPDGSTAEWEWDLNDTPPGGSADPVAASPFISSDPSGCLTFVWNSDGSVVRSGWTADIACLSSSLGCTDACDTNYDPNATTSDPSACSGVSICGCTDETACNYDATLTVDDGSCEYPLDGCTCDDALGCTDMMASNFDAAAVCNDGSCEYNGSCGGLFADSGGPDGDYGINEQDTTVICPDVAGEVVSVTFTSFSSENNFDEMLIFDGADTGAPAILVPDGSTAEWEWDLNDTPPGGSADPVAASPFISSDASGCLTFVWNSDGSVVRSGWTADVACLSSSLGCTDACDTNYDPNATTSDPSACSGVSICGCTDETACNYDATLTVDDGSCEYPLDGCTCDDALGCTDMMASNFDAAAMCNDGSCEYDGFCGGLFADIGGLEANYPTGISDTTVICPDDASELITVTFTSFAVELRTTGGCWDDLQIWEDLDGDQAIGEGDAQFAGGQADPSGGFCGTIEDLPNGGVFNSSTPGNCLVFAFFSDASAPQAGWTADVTCNSPTAGCTDPCDTNYNPDANIDDPAACSGMSNCGCTDPLASNYNESATIDDESCQYEGFCGGLFTDIGGPTGNYPTGFSDTTVICPDAGSEVISATFTSFEVEPRTTGGCWDDLQIWEDLDGDQAIGEGDAQFADGQADPSGGYCGLLEDLPNGGVFTASGAGNCLIFAFFSDTSAPQGGWTADISCAASSVPGCMDANACNYNPDATEDDGSCAELDCAGVCGGATVVDECGECGGSGAPTWYEDADGDGFGNPDSSQSSCTEPGGYVSNDLDADDAVFNSGDCSLIAIGTAICEEGTGLYNVILTWETQSPNPQLTIVNNFGGSGSVLTPSNQTQGSLQFGPFEEPDGYSFTIEDASITGCSETVSLAAVSCNVTAIELVEFTGRTLSDGNLLSWTTASEQQNDYFTLERSIDGINFEGIAKIQSQGNSSSNQNYSYTDTNPLLTAYYRLAETDIYGETTIASNAVLLERKANNFELISVSPVPSKDFVNIKFNASVNEEINVQIYNQMGQLIGENIADVKAGINVTTIDLTSYSAGVYFLNLISPSQQIAPISVVKNN